MIGASRTAASSEFVVPPTNRRARYGHVTHARPTFVRWWCHQPHTPAVRIGT